MSEPLINRLFRYLNVLATWLSQWGSKYLGDRNYSAIQILRYYYGENMYINIAEEISGVPSSWPGYNLNIGATGAKVRQLQEQLNAIRRGYPAIPAVSVDGIYGEGTQNAVRTFQRVFGLPQTGIVDYPTCTVLFFRDAPAKSTGFGQLTPAPVRPRPYEVHPRFQRGAC